MPEPEDKMSTSTLVSLIVGINLFILVVGGGLIWWLTLDKESRFTLKKKDPAPVDEKDSEKPGFFAKFFKRQSKEPVTVKKPSNDAESDPGFMDLSTPKD